MVFKFRLFHLSLILLVFLSCNEENSAEKEIAQIGTDIQIERFDKLFATADSSSLPKLKQTYPFMFSRKYKDSFWIAKMKDTLQLQLYQEVKSSIGDFNTIEDEVESLFNHLKFYFPEFNPPRVITATSMVDYRNKVVVTDTIALISIDTYLGSDHPFYSGIQKYIAANLRKEQIVVDMAGAYADKFIHQPQRKTLLDEMIYFGKQLYFKDKVIPFKTENERIGYSKAELEWAKANESYIWRYFVERELLYSTDAKLPNRFINSAPFSKFYLEEIDGESPGRLGQYIGWQIVGAYMDNNEVSLKELLIKSPEEIFNESRFKPRK